MDVRHTIDKAITNRVTRSSRDHLIKRFTSVRNATTKLTNPLEVEDFVVQAAEYVSPAKWHLAHVSWFFETFVLGKAFRNYQSLHPRYSYIFNSYYLQTGTPHTRSKRGLLSRPTVEEVFIYRDYVNKEIFSFLADASEKQLEAFSPVIEVGIHHEQQHQELLLTDIKYMFAQNPLHPVYVDTPPPAETPLVSKLKWLPFDAGVYHLGNEGREFTYDNERPRHRIFLESFELADRLTTNAEYMAFIEDGGYERPELWLDDGWATVQGRQWQAPLYWVQKGDEWHYYTLTGQRKVNPKEPVTHISYYEADAFARWSGARLPYEGEWEVAADDLPYEGNFMEEEHYHPCPLQHDASQLKQMYGNVWEWTCSAYSPYPGYQPLPGALGEYNGKFMCGQYVLRGGSCATPQTHIRKSYRNFFYPDARWQFSGIRLARTPA